MKDNDIPAFPGQQRLEANMNWNQTWEPGMTLRQWYAGLAMQKLVAQKWEEKEELTFGDVAQEAFRYADAMLKKAEEPIP